MKSGRLVIAAALALLPLAPPALQAQVVYVDDNRSSPGSNSASAFRVVAGPALSPLAGSPFATGSTGYAGYPAPVQELAGTIGGSNCLFVSDPLGSSTFPTGDVAAFTIAGSGSLTGAGNYFDLSNTGGANKSLPLAMDRRVGFPYLFAAFTGEGKIAFFKVGGHCRLVYASSTVAAGLSGSPIMSMAVTKAGPHVLVVGYGDGSIQSFKIGGGTLTPLAIFNSTGFTNHSGRPEGVDITANGKFAVFGDHQPGFSEVEVAKILPTGNLSATTDYPGLGPGTDSRNVWLSPGVVAGNFYLYVTNNVSGQVTTVRLSQTSGLISAAGTCTGGFTNPTALAPLAWTGPAGSHTIGTSGSGAALAVTEYGAPSSIALLRIQNATGCTREVAGSPFVDSVSNKGLASLDVFPSRPY